MNEQQKRNLVLIGFMGTGKSTLGRLCAAELGYGFCDSDHVLEARAGCSIADLFARDGEAQFREREREVIQELAAAANLVIATGGGAVMDTGNAARLRENGLVVLLTAPPDVILKRVGRSRTRPLLANAPAPHTRVEELLTERMPVYRRVAHCQVETGSRHPRDIAQQIVMLYQLTQN
jgi:shikimate kinase